MRKARAGARTCALTHARLDRHGHQPKDSTAMKCVICSSPLGRSEDNAYHPLCSARCKAVDLGKWLNAEYVVEGSAGATDGLGDGFVSLDLPEFEA